MAPLKMMKTSRVSPKTDSPIDSFILPLTFFDLRWVRSHPSQFVIFYKLSESDSFHESFYSLILPKLELSLSIVLCYYLPLIGHLMWDDSQDPKPHIVVLGHDTVSVTVAESDDSDSFWSVSRNGIRSQAELRVLVPELSVSCDSTSLFSLQITFFPNQGFSIGTAAHHVIVDGTVAAQLFKSWAQICKTLVLNETINAIDLPCLPKDLTPVIDRKLINVPMGLERKMMESLMYFSNEKGGSRTMKPPPSGEIRDDLVRITLELTEENVKKLKERVKKESSRCQSELHLSTFVVTNAYVWSCLVKARGGNRKRPVVFMYAADFRNLSLSVPKTYLGNCVFQIGCFGHKAETLMGEDGFVKAVEILSDSTKGLESKGIEELCELYIDGIKNLKPGTQIESVAGSNRVEIYGVDFGWGKPVTFDMTSLERYGAFTMVKRKDHNAGGAQLGLCLHKNQMLTFLSFFFFGLDNIVSRI